MFRNLAVLLVLTGLLGSGCAGLESRGKRSVQIALLPEDGIPADWRRIARREDQVALDSIADAWSAAVSQAGKQHARAIAQEGSLLRADAGLPRAVPTPGLYRCRAIRLGSTADQPTRVDKMPLIARFKPFDCVVSDEAGFLAFTKVRGTHRPGGYLWPDTDKRMIFLGGTAERDGEAASAYGNDVARNRVGVFERIGAFRWRLTLLGEISGARLEAIELAPAIAVEVKR